MRIVIIGNSAAGTAAIEAIRKYDNQSSIVQISDEVHPLYSRCLTSYYIAGKIDENKLLYRPVDFHKNMDVELHPDTYVEEVDTKLQYIKCRGRKRFEYDKLLVATGSSAKMPIHIPANMDGIFELRTLDHAIAIKNKISHSRNAIILGGGLIGMRAAEALSRCGLNVKVIIQSKHVLSQMIDYRAAQVIQEKILKNNIEILTQTDISEVIGKENKLVAIKTDTGKSLDCEILIAAKGVTANMQLIENSGIEKRKGILTNAYMQTNYENVFAAGDVAETYDIATEEYTINALWTCAVQQGFVAGENIINRQKKYEGSLGQNSLNFFDVSLISFGITSPKDESKYKILVDTRPAQNVYKKIVIQNNQLKGIILLGKIDSAGILLDLIRRKEDILGFEEELLNDHFNYGKLIKYMGKPAMERYSK